MTSHIHLRIVFVVLAGAALPSFADKWGPPQSEHWSRSRSYVLRLGSLAALELCPAGAKSKPIWYRGFVNGDWPPHRAFVADDGRHVVLVDAHGRLGYHEVLVFLGPQGEVLRSYKLDEILTGKEILDASHTVSSIHWSQHGWFTLRDSDRQFAFITERGTIRLYDTATGQRLPVADQLRSQIVSECISDARTMLGSYDPREQINGAVLLGVLDASQAAGELRNLLTPPPATRPADSIGPAARPDSLVQGAAACALLQIAGRDAFDPIEQCLTRLSSSAAPRFLEDLSRADRDGCEFGDPVRVGIAKELWDRLTRQPSEATRAFAFAQRLERDEGSYLRAHPELLGSKDARVRFEACVCLSQHALPTEVPLLRTGLADPDDINRLWAWRGLVRLQPPDIESILKHGLAAKDSTLRFEAMLALARRGDLGARQMVLGRVRSMKHHSHGVAGWGTDEIETDDLCVLVAELKMEEAREPLREAMENPCRDIRQSACGALAALGDTEALSRLRELARRGEALDRADAINWLDRVHDRESLDLLRQAATDEQPWIREAALKALANIGEHIQGRPEQGGRCSPAGVSSQPANR